MVSLTNTIAAGAASLLLASAATAQVAVRAGTLHTMAGEPIENGLVLIDADGDIEYVGTQGGRTIPSGYEVHECAVATPGLVDVRTTVGLTGMYNVDHDQDQLDGSARIQPQLRAIDAYNPREKLVAFIRSLGVTTVHTGHAPGELISGQTLIAKTRGGTVDEAVFVPAKAVAATLAQSAQRGGGTSPGTRAKMMEMLRGELIKARAYADKASAAEHDEQTDPPETDLKLESLAAVLAGEMPLIVTANRSQDIASAMRLADEFGFTLWLDMAAESYLFTEDLADSGVPVLLHPTMYRAWGDSSNLSYGTARTLADAGVTFAIQSGFEGYVPKVRCVLFEAAVAAGYGELGFDRALASVTISAAEILGIADRVGSLEVGKDGDVAMYDGDPFEYTTHCVGRAHRGRALRGRGRVRYRLPVSGRPARPSRTAPIAPHDPLGNSGGWSLGKGRAPVRIHGSPVDRHGRHMGWTPGLARSGEPPMNSGACAGVPGGLAVGGLCSLLGAVPVSAPPANAQCNPVLLSKLTAPDGDFNDELGFSIAVEGRLVVVGVPYDDDNGEDSGSAYVFDGPTGALFHKLRASDGAAGDHFGVAVAIDGGLVAVGAQAAEASAPYSGAAYIFDAQTGEQLTKIVPADGAQDDLFGTAIGIENGVVAVGAFRDDDHGVDSGSVYLFDALTREQLAKLLPVERAAGDWFGAELAFEDGLIAVGAPRDDDNGDDSGSAYVFDARTGSPVAWIIPDDGAPGDWFGSAIDIDADLVAVGAYRADAGVVDSGAAYLFDPQTGAQSAKLLPADPAENDFFGGAVAVDGGLAAIAAYSDDDNGPQSGSVYCFDAATGSQLDKIVPDDGATADIFGGSLALRQGLLAVGAWRANDPVTDSGSAYAFEITCSCGPADLAEPFGVLDLSDVTAFISAFVSDDPIVDFDSNGLLDLRDIGIFVSAFTGGCA
jgi:imidazolonepropionase-like amidohydrolase